MMYDKSSWILEQYGDGLASLLLKEAISWKKRARELIVPIYFPPKTSAVGDTSV